MFINISNHPSNRWSKEQIEAAKQYGEIVDIPFPNVPADASETNIISLADNVMNLVRGVTFGNLSSVRDAIHIMGESGLVFRLVSEIKEIWFFDPIYSTTERTVEEKDGQKISVFRFVKFRRYV